MSVILYALGVMLLLWGGYVLVTGDMIATLDIAATLMGYGAFVIGLGAVTGAITRLARALAAGGGLRDDALRASENADAPSLRPDHRGAPPPIALEAAADPYVHSETAAPEADAEPVFKAEPAPRSRSMTDDEPGLPPERSTPAAAPQPVVSKAERRRMRAAEAPPATRDPVADVEAPVVVAPLLGGGFSRREASVEPLVPPLAAPEPAPEPHVGQPAPAPAVDAVVAPTSGSEPQTPTPAGELIPEPAAAPAPEPKVPEWLARARARREARAQADDSAAPADASDGAAAAEETPAIAQPTVSEAPIEQVPETVAETFPEISPTTVDEGGESLDDGRTVLREGEHNGVLYRFFEDGSVEAQSEHGMRRFASLEELRATILAVRGRIDDEEQTEVEPRLEAELMIAEQPPESPEPAPAAATETAAPGPAPLVKPEGAARPEDDFEAALAALEGGADAGPQRGAPDLGGIRPTR